MADKFNAIIQCGLEKEWELPRNPHEKYAYSRQHEVSGSLQPSFKSFIYLHRAKFRTLIRVTKKYVDKEENRLSTCVK